MDLVSRVKGILLSPKSEWATIDTEAASVSSLFSGYVMILAAIGPICAFIGTSIFGYNLLGTAWKRPMGTGITYAIASYVMALVSVYVLALIIDALAPTFGGQKSQIQAMKVSAYSATASWIAGAFAILPSLAFLAILGLYSLYLLFLGLPALMKAPQEKAMGYTVVVIICMIVVFLVGGAVVGVIVPGASPSLGGLTR